MIIKKSRFILSLFIVFASINIADAKLNSQAEKKITVFFDHDCKDEIIKLIDDSTESIHMAVFSLSEPDIVDSLEKAVKRGVKIRFLTDHTQAFVGLKASKIMDKIGDFQISSNGHEMHNKIGVFDQKAAVTGSFNWTSNSSEHNDENCVVVKDFLTVAKISRHIDALWFDNSKPVSDCCIKNLYLSTAERHKGCMKLKEES